MSRLFEIRKYFRLTQKQLAEILGIGQNTVSMIESGQISLVERNRRALVEKLKINANWLDSGSGQMIMSDQPFDTGLLSDYIIPTPAIQGQGIGVPYYAKPVTGSMLRSFDDMANEEAEYYINIEPFNDCSFYRPVYGNSMSPRYNSGDVVACKRIQDKRVIMYGETYLCVIKIEADFYETIKMLRKNVDPSMITLKPLNPEFDETVVPLDSILELYMVKGKVERSM